MEEKTLTVTHNNSIPYSLVCQLRVRQPGNTPRLTSAPAQSGCITSAAPDRIHLFASTDVRSGPAKTKVGPRTVVV